MIDSTTQTGMPPASSRRSSREAHQLGAGHGQGGGDGCGERAHREAPPTAHGAGAEQLRGEEREVAFAARGVEAPQEREGQAQHAHLFRGPGDAAPAAPQDGLEEGDEGGGGQDGHDQRIFEA